MQELQVPMVDSFHCIYDSDGENEWGWQVALKGWVPGTVKGERVRSLIGCGRENVKLKHAVESLTRMRC